MLTIEIFSARQRGDANTAVTETVILAVVSLAALILFQRYEGTRKFAAAALKGAGRTLKPITSGRARAAAITDSRLLTMSRAAARCWSSIKKITSGTRIRIVAVRNSRLTR